MSADLADFGHDYRSVNLQRLSTYLLVRNRNLLVVEYQLKCCSVANDAVPDCRMVWSGAVCCRQGHQRVAWTAARLYESWWTTLRTFALSCELVFLTDFTVFITLLRLRVWHALKLLLALQGTAATCETRFGGLGDVKFSLKNSSDMYLLKIIKLDGI